ncbi:MAG: hypothetical protein ACW99L_19330 [Promethearchaeota archaeon]|jgi:hypothetical protein
MKVLTKLLLVILITGLLSNTVLTQTTLDFQDGVNGYSGTEIPDCLAVHQILIMEVAIS